MKVLYALLLNVALTSPMAAQEVSAGTPPSTPAATRPVDVCLLLDTSTSMRPAWDKCVAAMPELLSALKPGDRMRVVVFAEKCHVALDTTLQSDQDVYRALGRMATIKCNGRGSCMAAGFDQVMRLWGGAAPDPAVLMVLSDAIPFPPAKATEEWSARDKSLQPFRRRDGLQRILLGVNTEETDGASLARLASMFVPTQSFQVGEENLGDFREIMNQLHQLVDGIRVPAPTATAQAPATQPEQESPHWWLWVMLALVLGLAAAALGRRRRSSNDTVGVAELDSPVAALRISRWELAPDTLRVTGDATMKQFDVMKAQGLVVEFNENLEPSIPTGGNGTSQGVRLRLHADARGVRELVVPPLGTLLLKDDQTAFNIHARTLEEQLYQSLQAEATPLVVRPQGHDLRLRGGTCELRVQWLIPEGVMIGLATTDQR